MILELRLLSLGVVSSCLFVVLTSCGLYDPNLAPAPSRAYSVKVGSGFLTDKGPSLYVEQITSTGVIVSWRNGQEPWTLRLKEGRGMGNGRYLKVTEINDAEGTAIISYSETDRRGFGGAWAF